MISSINPKITIVTVAKDNEFGLLSTIQSLREQEYLNWQVVLVVPMSSPQTLRVAEEMCSDSRFVVLNDQGRGIYEAMNLGLRKCKSEYVWFMNAGDCFSNKESIHEILEIAEREQADLIVGRHSVVGKFDGRSERKPYLNKISRFKFAYNLRSGCHQAMLFRTVKLIEVGGYSTKYRFAADFEAVLKIVAFGKSYRTSKLCALVQPGGVADKNLKMVFQEKHQIRNQLLRSPFFSMMSLAWTLLAYLSLRIRHPRLARM